MRQFASVAMILRLMNEVEWCLSNSQLIFYSDLWALTTYFEEHNLTCQSGKFVFPVTRWINFPVPIPLFVTSSAAVIFAKKMADTTTKKSISNLCRLCAVEIIEAGVNIFDDNNSSGQLVTIINRYLPIKVLNNFSYLFLETLYWSQPPFFKRVKIV